MIVRIARVKVGHRQAPIPSQLTPHLISGAFRFGKSECFGRIIKVFEICGNHKFHINLLVHPQTTTTEKPWFKLDGISKRKHTSPQCG